MGDLPNANLQVQQYHPSWQCQRPEDLRRPRLKQQMYITMQFGFVSH